MGGRGAVSPRAAARSSAVEQKGQTMNDNPTTDVTLRSAPGALIVLEQDPRELRELLAQTLGGGVLELADLDRIRMPTGGGLTFEVPTPAGPESRPTITGVLVHVQQRRAYWAQAFDETGGGTPPACQSADGITGIGEPGGACVLCPHAKFQDDEVPACRLTAECVLFQPDESLPTILAASAGSVRPVTKYLLSLTKRRLRYSDVVTTFGLERMKSRRGILFSRLTCTMTGALEPAQRQRMREIIGELGFGTPQTVAVSSMTPMTPPAPGDVEVPEKATVDPTGDDDVPPLVTPTDDDVPF